MTISMKSFVVLVFVVGTALCAPDTRARREVLPGDPRYGTDYRHEHHHHGGGNGGNVQIVKAIGRYAGTFSGSGPSSGGVPFSSYGPPNHQAGTPIRQSNYQGSATRQPAPVKAPQPQQHYHVVQQAPQRRPTIPGTSYGVPQQYTPQPQPQPTYVQQPTYQLPEQRPVPFQTYGPPAQQPSPSVNRPQQLPQPTQNNGYLAPVVHQRPVVQYQPQQQPQYQPPAPVVQHVHVEHRPQPQRPQVQHVHVEQPKPQAPQVQYVHVEQPKPQAPQVQYVHVEHQPQPQPQRPQVQYVQVQQQPQPQPQRPQVQYVQVQQQPQPQEVQQHVHVEHHHEQTQQTQQAQHVHHQVYRPVDSYGAPVQQSQPAHEYIPQAVEESAPVSNTQVSYNVVHEQPAEGGVRASNDQPFPQFPTLADNPFEQFTSFPSMFAKPPSSVTDFTSQITQVSQFGQLNPSSFGLPQFGGGEPCAKEPASETNVMVDTSSSSSSGASSESETKTRSFPTLDLQSNTVADYQVGGSGRSGVSSGYPREQPQSTIQYVSPVSSPVAESVVVESVPESSPTNSQLVDSNGGYVY